MRGDSPIPSTDNQYYGGNTTCVEVTIHSGESLVFDAGTGLRRLGRALPETGEIHIFITSERLAYWQGLPFFQPLRYPGWQIHLYLPSNLADLPELMLGGRFFPLTRDEVKAALSIHLLAPGAVVNVGSSVVSALPAAEGPCRVLSYKLRDGDSVFLYSGGCRSDEELAGLLSEVNLAVVPGPQEAVGDLTVLEDWVERVGQNLHGSLVVSRHHPALIDTDLEAWRRHLLDLSDSERTLTVACEDLRVKAEARGIDLPESEDWLRDLLDTLSLYKDESIILDRILLKSRELSMAEAGTVYLLEGDQLVFTYTHNDRLFSVDNAHRHAYVNLRIPLSVDSITGYVATTGRSLNLPDVNQLPPRASYKFDDSFDKRTGYRTVSSLTVPIISRTGKLLGVMQLLNSLGEDRKPRPFSKTMEDRVTMLAHEAAVTLEMSKNVRSSISRLMRIASLHDPSETGPHAERVGSIAAEVYQQWAEAREEEPDAIRYYKGQLRLAAMLHDIGKVGVSDLILKKPGPLTDEERAVMRCHTYLGSTLFVQDTSDISELAMETTLHHHQKWDGTGYSGHPDVPVLSGEDIPLAARITALSDVFDALVSQRCYKEMWPVEEALDTIRKESGRHFDPELVKCFLDIQDLVASIYQRFPDEE